MSNVFVEQGNLIIRSNASWEDYPISEIANMKPGEKIVIDSWYTADGQRHLYKFGIEVIHKDYPNMIVKYFSGYYDDEREIEIFKIDLARGESLCGVYTKIEKPLLTFGCSSGEFKLYKRDLCEKPVGDGWSILTDFPRGRRFNVLYTIVARNADGVLVKREEPKDETWGDIDYYWVQFVSE